jgi:predicted peptidase
VTGVRCWLWALIAVALGGAAPAAESGRGFLHREFASADGQTVKYALFVPQSYTLNAPVPVILFLHGSGEAGTDGDRQTRVGIGEHIRRNKATFPFLVIMPQAQRLPEGLLNVAKTWWPGQPDGDRALAILAAIQREYRTDPKRLYLSGVSMGGFGVWALAAAAPNRWAAIVPVCGGGDPAAAAKLKDVPCWAFHGAADPSVPVQFSRTMVEAVRRAGGAPKYTEYAGVGHNSWEKAYATVELYTWLLQQKLK